MNIRRARASDFQAANALLDQLMSPSADRRPSMWSKLLERDGYVVWIAEVDAKLVGLLDLFILPDIAHGGKMGLINNLVVDERFREQGLGKSLLRKSMEYCQSQSVMELHAWTGFDNKPAIGLYKKLGFRKRALLMELEMAKSPRAHLS